MVDMGDRVSSIKVFGANPGWAMQRFDQQEKVVDLVCTAELPGESLRKCL